jgi:hypothetical protein
MYDPTVCLWEVATGELRCSFQGNGGRVLSLAFSKDGRRLASGSANTTAIIWDLIDPANRGRPDRLTVQDLEAGWADLAAEDGAKAYQALVLLVAAPAQSVPFLAGHLRPVPPGTTRQRQHVEDLITALDSDDFSARDKASQELESLHEEAEPILRQRLQGQPSPEVRQRLTSLLKKLEGLPEVRERLRSRRALEALERIGDARARQVLRRLGEGAGGAWLTGEARASLERLTRPGDSP